MTAMNLLATEAHTFFRGQEATSTMFTKYQPKPRTCRPAPVQSAGALDGTRWLSRTPGAACRCFQGCSKPELLPPGLSIAWTAGGFSCMKTQQVRGGHLQAGRKG